MRPITPVYRTDEVPELTDDASRAAVDYLFEALTFRPPTTKESDDYLQIVHDSIAKVGKEDGVFMGLSSIFLHRDALFRPELANAGTPDDHGRVMLQDWELGLAVNHALRYIKPDEELRQAIVEGRMRTREDVKREITRMLEDDSIRKPRVLQFFRNYFDYDLGGYICKDSKALASSGAPGGNGYFRAMFDATASTDRLIELILESDKDVLKQLLTTQKVVATGNDTTYFGRKRTRDEVAAAQQIRKKTAAAAEKQIEAELEPLRAKVTELEAALIADPKDKELRKSLSQRKSELNAANKKLQRANRQKAGGDLAVAPAKLNGPKIFARVSRKSFGNGSMKPERILAEVPEGERLGILTHPSWLVSHSDAMDNHAIHRGSWIRERLLGGGIPDVPITVDAQLPDEPNNTLRERMRVTREKYCWTCHQKMDPARPPLRDVQPRRPLPDD